MTPTSRSINIWILICCAMVFIMVVIGGITRLTHSGLSMVDWKPVTRMLPPFSEQDWRTEFEKYKESPEFKKINYDFSLDEYKSIYWWEYIHRLFGRLIGIVFFIPFVIFLLQKKIRGWLLRDSIVLLVLGAIQGYVGWYMVASGLVDRPSVSHFRLAFHLVTATSIIAYGVWVWLKYNYSNADSASRRSIPAVVLVTAAVVVMQFIWGAFVAGLKAGLIYNTWPLMDGQLAADAVGSGLSTEGISALWNTPAAVQFVHRSLGILVLILTGFLWFRLRKTIHGDRGKLSLNLVAGITLLQVFLGIITLISTVPVLLGVLHQSTGIVLILSWVALLFFIRKEA